MTPAAQLDGAVSSYPWSLVYERALAHGHIAFWDWHSFIGGYDIFANGGNGFLYPGHLILGLALGPMSAHDAFMALHVFGGGLAMFALLRWWRLGRPAAFFAGTAWMYAAFNTGWAQAEMIAPVVLLLPLDVLVVDRAISTRRPAQAVYAGAALATTLLAGNLVVFLTLAWVVGLYALCLFAAELVRQPKQHRKALLSATCLAAVLAAGLSAIWTIPNVLNLLDMGRQAPTLAAANANSQPLRETLGYLWTPPSSVAHADDLFVLPFVGKITLVLAAVGVYGRHRGRLFSFALAVLSILLPSGGLALHFAWYAVPPIRAVLGMGRLFFFAAFGLCVLAAFGLERITRWIVRYLASARRVTGFVPGAMAASAVVVALVELVPFAQVANPAFSDPRVVGLYPDTPVQRVLRSLSEKSGWPGLVLPITAPYKGGPDPQAVWSGTSLWGATAQVLPVDSVGGYDSAVAYRPVVMARVMQGTGPTIAVQRISTAFLPDFSTAWSRLDLAARFGVTHVYAAAGQDASQWGYASFAKHFRLDYDGRDGRIYAVNGPLRGPRIVPDVLMAKSPTDALNKFIDPRHDPRTSVVLEAGDGAVTRGMATIDRSAPQTSSGILSSDRGDSSASVHLRTANPTWLVMPIAFDQGWQAKLDGRPIRIRHADFLFSAVKVPSGEHTVTFGYRPPGFRAGLIISAISILLALGVVLFSAKIMPSLRGRRDSTSAG